MRGADVNFATDVMIWLKQGDPAEEVVGVEFLIERRGGSSQLIIPDGAPGLDDLHAGEEATHAVADDDHLFLGVEEFVECGELLAEAHGRVANGPAGRVIEEHVLILAAELGISPEIVDDVFPHAGVGT